MAEMLTLRIKVDEDWLALVAYRLALQCIVEIAEEKPWSADEQAAAEIAAHVLEQFPGRP